MVPVSMTKELGLFWVLISAETSQLARAWHT